MARAKTEFELKLVGPASDVAAVRRLAWLEECAAGPDEWERLDSTYYDSADWRLASAGLSLRIRNDPAGKMLTAKFLRRGESPVARLETERLIEESAPGFVTGVAEIDQLIGAAPDDLNPCARTVTDRWHRRFVTGGALVELSAEIGRAERFHPDRAVSPIAEIEIELIKGDAAAVFSLARRLIETFGGRLRVGVETKFDRALGSARREAKTGKIAIAPDASAGDLLAAAIAQIARRAVESGEAALATHDGEATRRLRVSLRRFRALERVFRRTLESEEIRDLALRARDWGRMIGEVRDLDVFIGTSLPLADDPALRARVEARLAEKWSDVGVTLGSTGFALFLLDLLDAAHLERWRLAPSSRLSMSITQYAEETLDRRWRRLDAAGKGADFAIPETLHALRIELNKFRYAAQFFRNLYPKDRRAEFFAAMSALQDAFGAINDAVVAQTIADEAAVGGGAGAARAAGFIAGYRSAQSGAAAAGVETHWMTFVAMTPFWRMDAVSDQP